MIIPVRDDTTLLIAKHARDLSQITHLYIADYDAIRLLQDKAETIRIAQQMWCTPSTDLFSRGD